jgi:hypothetical protein
MIPGFFHLIHRLLHSIQQNIIRPFTIQQDFPLSIPQDNRHPLSCAIELKHIKKLIFFRSPKKFNYHVILLVKAEIFEPTKPSKI